MAGRVFHAPLIEAEESLELCGIVSSRSEEIKESYPNVLVCPDYKELLKQELDIVVIASPNEVHFEQAKQAIEMGKHVVIDKPMTPTTEEAKLLAYLADQHQVILTVFHNRRLDGDFLTLKKTIETNELGKIVGFESNFNRFNPQVDKSNWRETTNIAGGVFYDLAPHLIDQTLVLFGKPDLVYANISHLRPGAATDDSFHVIMRYKDFDAHLNASAITGNTRERFVLHGLKGSISKYGLDTQESQLNSGVQVTGSEFGVDTSVFFRNSDRADKFPVLPGNYPEFYKNLSQHITNEIPLLVPSHEAILTMEIMERCLESVKERKEILV